MENGSLELNMKQKGFLIQISRHIWIISEGIFKMLPAYHFNHIEGTYLTTHHYLSFVLSVASTNSYIIQVLSEVVKTLGPNLSHLIFLTQEAP